MALTNRELCPDVETIFLAPAAGRSYISSSLVREVSRLGGDPAPFVPRVVLDRLRERFPARAG
jgi:pantetheine-phosphate adenylyltransferase